MFDIGLRCVPLSDARRSQTEERLQQHLVNREVEEIKKALKVKAFSTVSPHNEHVPLLRCLRSYQVCLAPSFFLCPPFLRIWWNEVTTKGCVTATTGWGGHPAGC